LAVHLKTTAKIIQEGIVRLRAFVVTLTIAIFAIQPGEAASNSTKAFSGYLNALQMDAVIPMMSTNQLFVGGLVVAKGKNADFYGLPAGVTHPTSSSGDPETFPAQTSKSSLSLSVALNALFGWSVGGNLAHSKNSTVNQIDATLYTSGDVDSALSNSKTQEAIKDLINRQHLKVYQVRSVSTTKTIKFSTSGSLGASVSVSGGNGTDAKATNCQNSSGSQSPTDSGNTGGNGSSPGAAGASQHSMQSQAAATSPTPGGSLQLCTSSDTSLTLATSNDLVFAVKLYEVALNGSTYVASAIPAGHVGNGGFSDLMNAAVANMSNSDVRRQPGAAAGFDSHWGAKFKETKKEN